MRHSVLGPGGVGGLVAGALAHAGEDVTVVVRPEAAAGYPDRLRVESALGSFDVCVACATTVPASDVLWLAVKAPQLDGALASIGAAASIGVIVPLLNGLDHVELLRSRYGRERVIPATIGGETERVAPGHIVHRSPWVRLNVSSRGEPLLAGVLADLQAEGFTCRFVDDEATLMWSKLVFLAPVALATSAAGATVGAVVADPEWRSRLESSVREACAVARAEGADVDADATLATILALPDGLRSSMQKDVARGIPPELDAIGGAIVRRAARHGLDVAVIAGLIAAVERKSTAAGR
jgi:2-dehydropantoate 2-reductase